MAVKSQLPQIGVRGEILDTIKLQRKIPAEHIGGPVQITAIRVAFSSLGAFGKGD